MGLTGRTIKIDQGVEEVLREVLGSPRSPEMSGDIVGTLYHHGTGQMDTRRGRLTPEDLPRPS